MSTIHVNAGPAFPDTRGFPRSPSPVHPEALPGACEGGERLAKFLGWFSLGLGAAALAAPRELARLIGARGDRTDRTIMRIIGLQEIACGVGILAAKRPAPWVWARVAGDVTHIAMAGGALAADPRRPDRMAATTAALAGIAALDTYNAMQLSRRAGSVATAGMFGPIEVHRSTTIKRPAEELYRFWRNFENLPRIMSHLESVMVREDGRSYWRAKAPAGMSVEWEAELTEDRPNEFIAWRSVGGQVQNSGLVRFVPAPGARGTEVHVALSYTPPAGALGALVARLFRESPEQQVYNDLRHFKQVMETGEIVLADGGRDGSLMFQPPAQPPAPGDRRALPSTGQDLGGPLHSRLSQSEEDR